MLLVRQADLLLAHDCRTHLARSQGTHPVFSPLTKSLLYLLYLSEWTDDYYYYEFDNIDDDPGWDHPQEQLGLIHKNGTSDKCYIALADLLCLWCSANTAQYIEVRHTPTSISPPPAGGGKAREPLAFFCPPLEN